jgi:hypothetical protein
MASTTNRAATGPLIMEQLMQLREEVKEIRETQQRRERQLASLSGQIDRFLAAEIDLTGTLVQVRSVVSANRDTVQALRAAAIDLKRSIDAALDLAVGDPSAER